MPSQNWGDLTKSLSDSELIEESTARLIAEHNDDPEAHLGVGQSLQSHKASEIIDHLARSIYTDKFSYDRLKFETCFESIDGWDYTAGVSLSGIFFVEIWAEAANSYNANFRLGAGDALDQDIGYLKYPFFKTTIRLQTLSNMVAYIGSFIEDLSGGWGFKIINSDLYSCYIDTNYAEQTHFLMALSNYYKYDLSFFISDDDIIHFVVNGLEIYSFSVPTMNNSPMIASYIVQSTNSTTKGFYIINLSYDQIS